MGIFKKNTDKKNLIDTLKSLPSYENKNLSINHISELFLYIQNNQLGGRVGSFTQGITQWFKLDNLSLKVEVNKIYINNFEIETGGFLGVHRMIFTPINNENFIILFKDNASVISGLQLEVRW